MALMVTKYALTLSHTQKQNKERCKSGLWTWDIVAAPGRHILSIKNYAFVNWKYDEAHISHLLNTILEPKS